jgi:hypothetical protein
MVATAQRRTQRRPVKKTAKKKNRKADSQFKERAEY